MAKINFFLLSSAATHNIITPDINCNCPLAEIALRRNSTLAIWDIKGAVHPKVKTQSSSDDR